MLLGPVPEGGGLDAEAILQAVESDFCPDGLCPLSLSEYTLLESGGEAALINGLLSPIDRRVLELLEASLPEPPPVDLFFERLQRAFQVPENLIA